MRLFPLIHILFWIAMTLAPQGTSRIVVTGPDKTWTWTKQESGWNRSDNASVWAVNGNMVTGKTGTNADKQDVSDFVEGVKDYDWKSFSSLKLGPRNSLTKKGASFVYTEDEGQPTAKRFVIEFKQAGVAVVGTQAELKALAKRIRDAQTDADRKSAEQELHRALDRYFDQDMSRREQELARIEKRVQKLRDLLNKRKASRKQIVDLQYQVLVKDAEGLGLFREGDLSNVLSSIPDHTPHPATPVATNQENQTQIISEVNDQLDHLMRAKMSFIGLWDLALIHFAKEHGGQLPATLAAAAPYFHHEAGSSAALIQARAAKYGIRADQFQLTYKGPLNVMNADIKHPSRTILLRERQPWLLAGAWHRAFAFADGHAEIVTSQDRHFTAWMHKHFLPPDIPTHTTKASQAAHLHVMRELKQIALALRMYADRYGALPDTLEEACNDFGQEPVLDGFIRNHNTMLLLYVRSPGKASGPPPTRLTLYAAAGHKENYTKGGVSYNVVPNYAVFADASVRPILKNPGPFLMKQFQKIAQAAPGTTAVVSFGLAFADPSVQRLFLNHLQSAGIPVTQVKQLSRTKLIRVLLTVPESNPHRH